jgi:hypothetical protein
MGVTCSTDDSQTTHEQVDFSDERFIHAHSMTMRKPNSSSRYGASRHSVQHQQDFFENSFRKDSFYGPFIRESNVNDGSTADCYTVVGCPSVVEFSEVMSSYSNSEFPPQPLAYMDHNQNEIDSLQVLLGTYRFPPLRESSNFRIPRLFSSSSLQSNASVNNIAPQQAQSFHVAPDRFRHSFRSNRTLPAHTAHSLMDIRRASISIR